MLINILIWDKHASALGIAFLLLCLAAAAAYQQAPKRATPVSMAEPDTPLVGNEK